MYVVVVGRDQVWIHKVVVDLVGCRMGVVDWIWEGLLVVVVVVYWPD